MIGTEAVLGVTAAVIGVAGMVPYIRDTLDGSTRPHRPTWLIWSVLAGVACLSQRTDGASWSLLATAVHAVLNSVVLVLAVRGGESGHERRDTLVLGLAGAGVVGWIVAGAPIVAIVSVIVADAVGLAAMTPKAHRSPESETLLTYLGASLGGALAAGAVGAADISLLLYPVYYCLANAAMGGLIVHRRRVASHEFSGRSRPGSTSPDVAGSRGAGTRAALPSWLDRLPVAGSRVGRPSFGVSRPSGHVP